MASINRKPYEGASTITQSLLNECQDNLINGLRAIVEIEAPDGSIIRVSDRNMYIGEHFYEARTNFPQVTRSVGDWLGGALVFSEINLKLSNVDGKYNKYLPTGDDFSNWVGRDVNLKIGLDDSDGTYISVFAGTISNESGIGRDTKSINIKARNNMEKVNTSFPSTVFTNISNPKAADDVWGNPVPVVYGDWTQDVTQGGSSLPAIVVNGGDPIVNSETVPVEITIANPAIFTSARHRFSVGDKVVLSTAGTLPSGFSNEGEYYIASVNTDQFTLSATSGGSSIGASGSQSGSHEVIRAESQSLRNIQLQIADHQMQSLDTESVYLLLNDRFFNVPSSLITNVSTDKNYFEIQQDSSSFVIGEENYKYSSGDKFYLKAVGKAVDGGYNDSAVWIARDILKTYGGLVDSDFDDTWASFRDKGTISSTKARAYVDDEKQAMEYAVSLLEQVALEPFVNRDLKFSLNSLHFDDWDAEPSYTIRNWDVELGSMTPTIDSRNNFNRLRAVYNFLPNYDENAWSTPYFKNQDAITQQGSAVTKVLLYPNLYETDRVQYFASETLKLTSAFREVVTVRITPRGFLLDIGDFVYLNIDIGSIQYSDIPCMIRDISYDPKTLKIQLKLWSMAMIPFPNFEPSFTGIVGGFDANIIQE